MMDKETKIQDYNLTLLVPFLRRLDRLNGLMSIAEEELYRTNYLLQHGEESEGSVVDERIELLQNKVGELHKELGGIVMDYSLDFQSKAAEKEAENGSDS